MEQIHLRDKMLETKTTAIVGPRPWDIQQYIYEKPKDDQRSSHSDPRLESHGQHQIDSDFPSSDGDYGYGLPAFGSGFTPDLSARTSTASDQGTLAGGGSFSSNKKGETADQAESRRIREANQENFNWQKEYWTNESNKNRQKLQERKELRRMDQAHRRQRGSR
jgi:hypothetical protein